MNDTREEQRCRLCGRSKMHQRGAMICEDCLSDAAEAIELFGEDELERWSALYGPTTGGETRGT